MITNRPRRLVGVSYVGHQRYFLTFCTAFRRPRFRDREAVAGVLAQLRQTSALFEFAIVAYCFMPDHLHVLVAGASERADLEAFVKRFKQLAGFDYKQRRGEPLWQPGYHERVLRDNEGTEAVARYILANPVRAGLTRELGEYEYAGSEIYDLKGLLTAFDGQT